ncbi:hypothetical protein Tco_1303857, partial [Tanacetum coccineum]
MVCCARLGLLSFIAAPLPSLCLGTSLFEFQVGRGYSGRVRWEKVRGELGEYLGGGIARKPWEKGGMVLAPSGFDRGGLQGLNGKFGEEARM